MHLHSSIRNHSFTSKRKKQYRAFLLAFLLGPLGLFYTDSFGGFVTAVIALICSLVLPVAGIILTWIICMIWAVVAVNRSIRAARSGYFYYSGR